MTDIQILATTEHDYPFGTLMDDQNHAWLRLTSMGYSRLQIQRAIVRELENMDTAAWNEFISSPCDDLQAKTYRIRERLNNCTQELKRQQRKANALARKNRDDYARFEAYMERFGD